MNLAWLQHQVVGEEQDREHRFFYWLRLAVLTALAACALFAAKKALAAPVYEDPQMSLRLTDRPCPAEVLKFIVEDRRPLYRESEFVWEGRPLKACYRVLEDGSVSSVDEEGDQLTPRLPIRAFKNELGA